LSYGLSFVIMICHWALFCNLTYLNINKSVKYIDTGHTHVSASKSSMLLWRHVRTLPVAKKTRSSFYLMHEVVAQLFGQRIWQGGRRFSDDECFFLSYPYFLSSRPLKIQLCPPLCICFRFDPHSFDFYFFYFNAS
jgi:hypothetical protein